MAYIANTGSISLYNSLYVKLKRTNSPDVVQTPVAVKLSNFYISQNYLTTSNPDGKRINSGIGFNPSGLSPNIPNFGSRMYDIGGKKYGPVINKPNNTTINSELIHGVEFTSITSFVCGQRLATPRAMAVAVTGFTSGSINSYIAGGFEDVLNNYYQQPSSVIEKFAHRIETTSSFSSSLSVQRANLAGLESMTKGYFIAGESWTASTDGTNSLSLTTTQNSVQTVTFSNDTMGSTSMSLTVWRRGITTCTNEGSANFDAGYLFAGQNQSGLVEKMYFPTETLTALAGTVTQSYQGASSKSNLAGYIFGGLTDQGSKAGFLASKTLAKWTFTTETGSALTNQFEETQDGCGAGTNSISLVMAQKPSSIAETYGATLGYVTSLSTSTDTSSIFSTTFTSNLSAGQGLASRAMKYSGDYGFPSPGDTTGGISLSNFRGHNQDCGYQVCGNSAAGGAGAPQGTIESYCFSTGAVNMSIQTSIAALVGPTGTSSRYSGYIGGGIDGIAYTSAYRALRFVTETYTTLSANMEVAAAGRAGFGNNDYGYFYIGASNPSYSATGSKMTYATETSSTTSSSFTTKRNRPYAVSSPLYGMVIGGSNEGSGYSTNMDRITIPTGSYVGDITYLSTGIGGGVTVSHPLYYYLAGNSSYASGTFGKSIYKGINSLMTAPNLLGTALSYGHAYGYGWNAKFCGLVASGLTDNTSYAGFLESINYNVDSVSAIAMAFTNSSYFRYLACSVQSGAI